MRQCRTFRPIALKAWRPEAKKTKIGLLRICVGKAPKRDLAVEQSDDIDAMLKAAIDAGLLKNPEGEAA